MGEYRYAISPRIPSHDLTKECGQIEERKELQERETAQKAQEEALRKQLEEEERRISEEKRKEEDKKRREDEKRQKEQVGGLRG